MNPEEITALMKHTLIVMLELASPFLLISLAIGSLVSLVQSFTHIHEPTLSFAPKIFVLSLGLIFLLPWIIKIMVRFTTDMLIFQWEKIVNFTQYAC